MGLLTQNIENPTPFIVEAKAFQIALWDEVFSPPWEQRKKWVPT
jgi:hypothetical protein